jgi:alginate O-acetyltransferase complex protein AlgJ
MLHSESALVNKMSSSRWEQLYSKIFVLTILAGLLLIMVQSLTGGFSGFDDNFPERARLISTFNHLRYSMGDQVFPQVLVGKEGWLQFWAGGNLDDYQNAWIVRPELKRIHQKLERLNEELTRRGITLIVVVAPNKATIYPDKVPEQIEKINKQSRLDVLLELMNRTSSSYIVDVRPALLASSKSRQIYYKTDSHWNGRGAFIAYREIMTAASQTYPELQPYNLNQFEWNESRPIILDLAKLLGVNFIREPWSIPQPAFEAVSHLQRFEPQSDIAISWGYNGQAKTLVMYHDSFGKVLRQFLQHQFRTALYIPTRDPDVSNTPWINIINPDIVILEIVERDVPYLDILLSKLLKQFPQQN